MRSDDLPINEILGTLKSHLSTNNSAVIIAPPGAGKTTRIPIALMNETWLNDRQIVMLEPRRIAARNAANYMAKLLGERVGETIGYKVRLEGKVSSKTKILVVTEGVFSRMILDDPKLSKVGAVIFDEFHERSLDADLGLALALDIQSALRPELRILPMSATLDGARVSGLFDDPKIIESKGTSFPVEIEYLTQDPSLKPAMRMADAVLKIIKEQEGSLLCFLPGQGDILKCAELLHSKLDPSILITPLYGALSPKDQDLAIAPVKEGERKIVLATSIAETSITIDGIRIVVDSGLARVPKFEPNSGLTRLETVKASKASITQRSGRAGRTQAGIAYRLWHQGQTQSLPDFDRPEIIEADLSNLVLDLASWGVSDPSSLKWIDPPPAINWKEARNLLLGMGALDETFSLTKLGQQMHLVPLSPRLAKMVIEASKFGKYEDAARIALLISERGVGGRDIDLNERLKNLKTNGSSRAKAIRNLAMLISRSVPSQRSTAEESLSSGALLSFAFPTQIAKKTGTSEYGDVTYQLANGRKAILDGLDRLTQEEFIVIAEMQGSATASRIMSASAIDIDEIKTLHEARIVKSRSLDFDPKTGQFRASDTDKLEKLVLKSTAAKILKSDQLALGIMEAIKTHGLGLIGLNEDHSKITKPRAFQLLRRLEFLSTQLPREFEEFNDAALLDDLDNWLLPFIEDIKSLDEVTDKKLVEGLEFKIGFEILPKVARLAPPQFQIPTKRTPQLTYKNDRVFLAVKVQELYGLEKHPHILDGKFPITLELLSPAGRPIQTTQDIKSFWAGSWRDVKKEMKGRYPKHFWPDDPANEIPRVKTTK